MKRISIVLNFNKSCFKLQPLTLFVSGANKKAPGKYVAGGFLIS